MYKGRTVVGFIPARGGSVRIPGKNMIDLCGKPLIQYTIDSSKASKYIDFTMVSSDDKDILEFSVKHGAGNIVRPKNISGSGARTEEAIYHAIKNYLKNCDIMVMLQPTSPIRNDGRIDESIKLLIDGSYGSVVSVYEKFLLTWDYLSGNGHPNYEIFNRPDSGTYKTLVENGSIYTFNIEAFMANELRVIPPVGLLKMTEEESVDIDTLVDLRLAECTMKERNAITVYNNTYSDDWKKFLVNLYRNW